MPDARSFIQHANSIMDLSAHHVPHWSPSAERKIGAILGAREIIVLEAPVKPVDYQWVQVLSFFGFAVAGQRTTELV